MQHKHKHKIKTKYAHLPDFEQPAIATKVKCPSCTADISASDLNITDMVGKCQECDSIFSIKSTIQKIQAASDDLITDEIGRPEGIELNYFHNEFEITAQQGTNVWHVIGASGSPLLSLMGLGIYADKGSLVALGLALIGLMLLTWSIVKLIRARRNKIFIIIDDQSLDVLYRPQNFVKDKSYSKNDIEQVFVRPDPVLGGHALYIVLNSVNGQSHKRILGGLKSLLKAKYMEQEIERHLGIPNKKVSGELS